MGKISATQLSETHSKNTYKYQKKLERERRERGEREERERRERGEREERERRERGGERERRERERGESY